MTKLSLSNLVNQIKEAGITYLPADRIYYKKFPYKVELNPVFKGLELDIITWVDRLPNVEYKRRIGGENSLIYFRDADSVMALCKEFTSLINSVTGPISTTHKAVIDDTRNIIMREKLYYDQFRYHVTFTEGKDFYDNCGYKLIEWLETIEKDRFRARRLHLMRNYYAFLNDNPMLATICSPASYTHNWLIGKPGRSITLFLSQPEDFVYVKLVTSGFIIQSHEIVLLDELT